jgi:hypothetical protein
MRRSRKSPTIVKMRQMRNPSYSTLKSTQVTRNQLNNLEEAQEAATRKMKLNSIQEHDLASKRRGHVRTERLKRNNYI